MRKLLAAVALTAGLVAVAAPAVGADDERGRTSTVDTSVAGVVAASGGAFDHNPFDFDLLLNAVQAAGLVDALSDPAADISVFAPNDAAFIRLARTLGYAGHDEAGAFDAIVAALTSLGGGDPIPVLTNVLLYHVADGRTDVRTLVRTQATVTTKLGATVQVRGMQLVDADPDVANAKLSVTIRATNGNILPVSRVLLPVNL